MSAKKEFVEKAQSGKVLAKKCQKCDHHHLATVYFCQKCGAKEFESITLDGQGTVSTYTIITVPPTGFEGYTPYAWVVLSLTDSNMRVSGFMADIATPADLLVGTKAKIVGFDKRGIILEKQ